MSEDRKLTEAEAAVWFEEAIRPHWMRHTLTRQILDDAVAWTRPSGLWDGIEDLPGRLDQFMAGYEEGRRESEEIGRRSAERLRPILSRWGMAPDPGPIKQ